ncbi:putative phosphoesterase [Nocardia neocaledoniensis NBRC 108232]|uniref:5'-phosphoribosyl-monophospho-decaprenol phosphatase n=1 Tax=Nocardia neocaledoniensis TaxID=236511 RepID=A0A317NPN6_9NOCA|nr:5'-phosphoribosyl-monophospho-decaprenol phosphatase [Nocardia neocaledoniensis]GEM29408.1 putative phosphoesterase [Nocardia neocaledoniensis NBRC 108232]
MNAINPELPELELAEEGCGGECACACGEAEYIDVPLEVGIINTVQTTIGTNPAVVSAARGMSHFGEHALGWVGIAAAGWLVDKPRRRQWAGVAVGAVGAHAASIVIKRIVRRPRPNSPAVQVNVSTPSKLSFPSSHATSTTAAAVLLGRLTGLPLPAVLVPPMLLSRVVLGVHYPSDVLAGSALGAASAAAVLAAEKRLRQ